FDQARTRRGWRTLRWRQLVSEHCHRWILLAKGHHHAAGCKVGADGQEVVFAGGDALDAELIELEAGDLGQGDVAECTSDERNDEVEERWEDRLEGGLVFA